MNMSEQAKITTLTDHEGNPIAPRTTADAVSYGDKTVGGALDSVREEMDNKAGKAHVHSVQDITSGTLPVARGGTGQATLQALRNSMGLGNTTGALPEENGGTGSASLSTVTVGFATQATSAAACSGLTFGISASEPMTVTNNKITFVYG